MTDNFYKLGQMLECLKVESFLHHNNKSLLESFFNHNDYQKVQDISCQSFYKYNIVNINQIISYPSKLKDLHNYYHNEAADQLKLYGQHTDSLKDEL